MCYMGRVLVVKTFFLTKFLVWVLREYVEQEWVVGGLFRKGVGTTR